ncbi:hypothetical protein [Aliamphritea ceti]|uniref:hypothetical protein n=1 Tax=Aliamphritea ceti TaxID=1524258 RepID=UPI0021C47B67|nr:hypothetical protein [Aliamphritea ceti]
MNCPNCQQEMKRFKARHVRKQGIPMFLFGPKLPDSIEWVPQCFECDPCDLRIIDQSGEYLGGDQHAS